MSKRVDTKSKTSFLLVGISILLCVRHVLQLLGLTSIASILFKCLYVLVFLFLLKIFIYRIRKPKRISNLFFFLVGVVCIGWMFLLLWFNFRAKLEMYVALLLAIPIILCNDEINPSRKNGEVFFIGLTIVAVTLVLSMAIPSNYEGGILLLYTLNPNQSGLLYMSVFLGIYVYAFSKRNWALWSILLLGLLLGCWLTESRTAFSACVICVLCSAIFYRRPKIITKGLFLALLIFVLLPFFSTAIIEFLGKDFMFMGSAITSGREEIWPRAIEDIFSSPFSVRVGQVLAENYGVNLGAHNVWLDITWNFSLPVGVFFLFTCFLFGKNLADQFKKAGRKSAAIAACFIAGLVHMSFEAALISGALDYTLYFLLTLFSGKALLNEEGEI